MSINRVRFFFAISLATFACGIAAAPGDFDKSFGNGGVLDLSEASNRRIPVPNPDSFTPGSGNAIAFGPDGKVYIGGGFTGSSFVARVFRDGTLDRSFSAGGVLLRSGFLANTSTTDTISVLPSGRIVTSDVFRHFCGFLCPPGTPDSGRLADSFAESGTQAARFADGIPVQRGRDVVSTAAVFKDGGVVALNRFGSGMGTQGSLLNVAALRGNGERDAAFERNAGSAISCAVKDGLWRIIASVDAQDRLVVALGQVDDVTGIRFTTCVFRLNRDGLRDTTFGVNGVVTFSDAITPLFLPAGIAFSAEGGIRLALTPGSGQAVRGPAKAGQIRLTATGLPDGRFADGAIVAFDTPLASNIVATQPLPDGSTVVAGYLPGADGFATRARPAVARMASSVPDTSFGPFGSGVVSLFNIDLGVLIDPGVLAVSGTDGSVFVLSATGTQLVKLQGSPAPAAPRYDGLWWRSPGGVESGWGLNLTHQGDILFATWFTYDVDGSGMWLVMTRGERIGDAKFAGPLYRTTGPAFNQPFNPALFNATEVGIATLDFSDANNGVFTYRVNSVTQSKPITRQVFGAQPVCTAGGSPGVLANYQGLWWNAPENSESGWGINLIHQSDTLFATWFTYDAGGKGMWLVMTNGARTAAATPTYRGALYRTRSPSFDADPWLPGQVSLTAVGTASFSFADANTAQFDFVVEGFSKRKQLVRQIFASPPGVCR